MSNAPSLLDSVPPASRPTKPTLSFFWSACAAGNTPPFRDFCTMTETGPAPTRWSTARLKTKRWGPQDPAGASLLRITKRERREATERKGGDEVKRRRDERTADWLMGSFFSPHRLPEKREMEWRHRWVLIILGDKTPSRKKSDQRKTSDECCHHGNWIIWEWLLWQ